jgi:hypothetical protein
MASQAAYEAGCPSNAKNVSNGFTRDRCLKCTKSKLTRKIEADPDHVAMRSSSHIHARKWLQPSGVYAHLPTTFVGSHPGKERSKAVGKDADLGFGHENDPNINVTKRDLVALKENATFLQALEGAYLSVKDQNDGEIIEKFVQMIEACLNLEKADRKP